MFTMGGYLGKENTVEYYYLLGNSCIVHVYSSDQNIGDKFFLSALLFDFVPFSFHNVN